jgi:hypothetical protein
MIIGKVRSVIAVALTVSCIFALFSCKARVDNSGVLEALGSMREDAATQTQELPAAEYYQVIIPSVCGGELSLAARRLADSIEERTGIDCGVFYDAEDLPRTDSTVEILLGNTNRAASRLALYNLRVDDYVCRFVDGALVIGGVSDQATLAAVERFESEVLPDATSARLMNIDGGFEHIATYDIKSVLLRGFDIGDYAIVYTHDGCKEFSEYIKKTIAQTCGRYLDVSNNSQVKGRKEIVVSFDSSADGMCYITAEDEDIRIVAEDSYGVSRAAAMFCTLLFANTVDGAASFENVDNGFSCRNDALSVMHMVSAVSADENELEYIIDLADMINGADADVMVLEKMSSVAFDVMSYRLSADLGVILRQGHSPVIYRKDRLTPISATCETDGGLSALNVEFSCSVTGERYHVMSLSSDGTSTSIANIRDRLSASDTAVTLLTSPLVGGQKPDLSPIADTVLRSYAVNVRGEGYCLATLRGGEGVSVTAGEPVNDGSTGSVWVEISRKYSEEYLAAVESENSVE